MKNFIFVAKIFIAFLLTNCIYGQNLKTDIPKRCNVVSNFSINQTECDTYTFTSLITSGPGTTIVGYTWDFGDGTTVGNQSPVSHTYNSNGTYTVKLAVYGSYLNSNGTQSLCKDSKFVQVSVNCASTDCGTINSIREWNNSCVPYVTYFGNQPGQITLNPGWTITQYKWTHLMSGGTTIVAYGSPSTVYMPCDLGFVDLSTLEVTATNFTGETCILTKSVPILSGGSQFINGDCCLNKVSFDVFPNPVSDNLMIRTNIPESALQDIGSLVFELYDIYGALIRKTVADLEESSNQINVSNLNNGMYFLKIIKNDEVVETKRILKN